MLGRTWPIVSSRGCGSCSWDLLAVYKVFGLLPVEPFVFSRALGDGTVGSCLSAIDVACTIRYDCRQDVPRREDPQASTRKITKRRRRLLSSLLSSEFDEERDVEERLSSTLR